MAAQLTDLLALSAPADIPQATSAWPLDMTLSADTGSSASDFITHTAAQTISGTLSSPLDTGEQVRVSLDNGASWTAAATAGSGWSLAVTLESGTHAIQVQVVNATGVASSQLQQAYTLDTSRPGVIITSDTASLKIGETATLTFTFTEDPGTTFGLGDVQVTGGTLDDLRGSGLIYTATYTPHANSSVSTASFSIQPYSYQDVAGNAGNGAGLNIKQDMRAPEAPSTPTLDTARDTSTQSDETAAHTLPTFSGTAEDGATVHLYDSDTLIGSTGVVSGRWSITSEQALDAGVHAISATVTDQAGNLSAASAALTLGILTGTQTASGTAHDDAFTLSGTGNTVMGGAGNDTFVIINGGANRIEGGTGQDLLQLGGNRSDYALRVENGHLLIKGGDGSHTLVDIDTLRWAEGHADASVSGSIGRLHEALLGRSADSVDLAFWNARFDQGLTLEDVAQGILSSPESQLQDLDNTAFVLSLYQSVLQRDADTDGLAFWAGELDSGRLSLAQAAVAFSESVEKMAQPVTTTVDIGDSEVGTLIRLYATLFERRPDEEGLNHWLARYEAGLSLHAIANGFLQATEAAGQTALNDRQFITGLYQNALHREASDAETDNWVSALETGQADRGMLLLSLADSAQMIALTGAISTTIDVA